MPWSDIQGLNVDPDEYLTLASEIVSAFVSNSSVAPGELPGLIAQVHDSLKSAATGKPLAQPEKPTPHIPIKRTITPDYLISLEDRRPYKSMKRHLTRLGLTPEQYRSKWGLPADYPMVAPSYAAQRSELAKRIGLGSNRKKAPQSVPTKRSRKAKEPAG
jgi:predicted transcriptional regulator